MLVLAGVLSVVILQQLTLEKNLLQTRQKSDREPSAK